MKRVKNLFAIVLSLSLICGSVLVVSATTTDITEATDIGARSADIDVKFAFVMMTECFNELNRGNCFLMVVKEPLILKPLND